MMLYSGSRFRQFKDNSVRNLIGRANRLLHWYDMLMFKNRGILRYDMCGIDITQRTPETTRIAQFKRGFGGQIVPTCSETSPRSLKGTLVISILKACKIDL
jgi:lipid II:glycine glycyltransferase (peptidoglycan interpeptide bridge formation enzyme)